MKICNFINLNLKQNKFYFEFKLNNNHDNFNSYSKSDS